MKTLTLTIALVSLAFLSSKAQLEQQMTFELPELVQLSFDHSDQDERKIEVSELPVKIRTALNQIKNYEGWHPKSAHVVEDSKIPSSTFYKIEITNGIETKTIKMDADGAVLV